MKLEPAANLSVSAPPRAVRHRSPVWRFALPALAVLVAASWLAAWETRGRVAPTGVATPAGPRHADPTVGARRLNYPGGATRNPPVPGARSGRALRHLRRGLLHLQLSPARLGSGPGDRLAGLRPGRIRRPRPAGPRARVSPPRRRSARHDLPPDARGDLDALPAERGRRDPAWNRSPIPSSTATC